MKTTFKSPNLTGKEWITRLEKANYQVSSYAKELLEKIVPTKNTYEIAILKVSDLGKNYPTTQEIRDEAKKRGYITPPVELAPILREQISDEEIEALGLWWLIVAHEPITDSARNPLLLGLSRIGDGQELDAYYGWPGKRWSRGGGFVFLVPQGTSSSEPQDFSDTLPSDSPAELSSEASLELRVSAIEKWINNVRNQLL